MSELYTKLVFGQTRKVLATFKKGERITYHPDGDVVFNEHCVVDKIEVYKKREPIYVNPGEEFGEWKFERYLWDTLRPADKPTPPPSPPTRTNTFFLGSSIQAQQNPPGQGGDA